MNRITNIKSVCPRAQGCTNGCCEVNEDFKQELRAKHDDKTDKEDEQKVA